MHAPQMQACLTFIGAGVSCHSRPRCQPRAVGPARRIRRGDQVVGLVAALASCQRRQQQQQQGHRRRRRRQRRGKDDPSLAGRPLPLATYHARWILEIAPLRSGGARGARGHGGVTASAGGRRAFDGWWRAVDVKGAVREIKQRTPPGAAPRPGGAAALCPYAVPLPAAGQPLLLLHCCSHSPAPRFQSCPSHLVHHLTGLSRAHACVASHCCLLRTADALQGVHTFPPIIAAVHGCSLVLL